MYRRKIEAVFEAWKNEPNHKPLVAKIGDKCGDNSKKWR